MGASIGLVTAGIGAASSLSGLFGGDSGGGGQASSVNVPTGYQFRYMEPADTNAYAGAGSMNELAAAGRGLGQRAMSNPWQGYGIQGAYDASQMGQQQANNAYGWGQAQSQTGASIMPYAYAVGNTAFDPQSALYNRTLQQTQEQQRVAQAARGINMTPYGGGLENDALRNFNIDWQNQQLNRQVQGGNALASMLNTAGTNMNYGQQLANNAPALYQTASLYPYQAAQGMTNDAISGLNNSSSLTQSAFEDYLNYLKAGNNAQQIGQNAAQLNMSQNQMNNTLAQQGFNNQQTLGKNFGSSMAGIANNWPSSWSFG